MKKKQMVQLRRYIVSIQIRFGDQKNNHQIWCQPLCYVENLTKYNNLEQSFRKSLIKYNCHMR